MRKVINILSFSFVTIVLLLGLFGCAAQNAQIIRPVAFEPIETKKGGPVVSVADIVIKIIPVNKNHTYLDAEKKIKYRLVEQLQAVGVDAGLSGSAKYHLSGTITVQEKWEPTSLSACVSFSEISLVTIAIGCALPAYKQTITVIDELVLTETASGTVTYKGTSEKQQSFKYSVYKTIGAKKPGSFLNVNYSKTCDEAFVMITQKITKALGLK